MMHLNRNKRPLHGNDAVLSNFGSTNDAFEVKRRQKVYIRV